MKTITFKAKAALIAVLTMGLSFLANAQTKILVDVNRSYPKIQKVEVDGGSLEIRFVGSQRPDVQVEAFLESNYHNQDIVFVQIGGVLKITRKLETVSGNWNNIRTKGHIYVNGPETTEVVMRGGSGQIHLEQVKHPETIVQVGSGKVTAKNITGNLDIQAGSGNLNISGIKGNVQAKVGSGKAEIMDVEGEVNFFSGSGNVTIQNINGVVALAMTSGYAKLEKIQELGNVRMTSGNLNANEVGLGKATALYGTSGNIRIKTNSNLSDFNFKMMSTSGNVTIGNTRGKTLQIDNKAETTIQGNITSGNISITN